MRLAVIAMVLAMTIPAVSYAEEREGTMERIGAAIDESVEKTRDFLSDSAITTRVKKRLVRDEYVSGFEIRVTTVDGKVILEGDAPSEDIAKRAVDIAKSTKGVASVENRIWIVTRAPSTAK